MKKTSIRKRLQLLGWVLGLNSILFFIYSLSVIPFHSNQTKLVEFDGFPGRPFCVIAVIFNPASFQSRYALYRQFKRHILLFDLQLITVELAFGSQNFQVTSSENRNHIQLRTKDVLWYKENLINIGIRRAPPECEYIAWIDTEIEFLNKNWVNESMDALEKYKIIQPFEYARFLGPNSEVKAKRTAFGKCKRISPSCNPGFAWVTKLTTLSKIDGLFDLDLVGEADSIMAVSFVGKKRSLYKKDYLKAIKKWSDKSYKYINGSIGYVQGQINHFYHGSLANRSYRNRKYIIASKEFPYKPQEHVYYDADSLLRFKSSVREHFMKLTVPYFFKRNEDS